MSTTSTGRTLREVSEELAALLFLVAAPVILAGLFWLMIFLEERRPRPGRRPFDPPEWW